MDTISMLLTGWIIFFFCSIVLFKYIYIRFLTKSIRQAEEIRESDKGNVTQIQGPNDSETINVAKKSSKLESSVLSHSQLANKKKNESVLDGKLLQQLVCTGPDKIAASFINSCYHWLYSSETIKHKEWVQVKDTFIDVVNKTLRDSKKESPVFVSIVDTTLSEDISLTNLFAECEHTNNIKITCDCEAKLYGVLSLYSTEHGSQSCEFFVDRLSGRLNILVDCEEDLAIVKFDGWPEICFGIKANPPFPGKDTQIEPSVIEDLGGRVTAAIRNVVLEIELKRFQSFPKHPTSFVPKTQKGNKQKYLLLKVVGGKEMGLHKGGCEEPFCVIEIDDPPQKFQTPIQKARDPDWNENFVFNIAPGGGEILFEVYDRVGTRFLGCHIISVDEIGTASSRYLPLKSRRMEMSDQITGSLEVQFTFLEENEYLQKSPQLNRVANGGLKAGRGGQWEISAVSDTDQTGLKDHTGINSQNVNSLIIHPARKGSVNLLIRPIVKIERKANGYYFELGDANIAEQEHRKSTPVEECETGLEGQYGEERGRRRTRRGDIFTSIRRRFSKGRSRSAATPEDDLRVNSPDDDLFNRSLSVDRKNLNSANQLNSLGMISARSSASELSGLSSYSTTTFIHENSTLVIECVENRIRKYFLVPPHLAETGKWKKRGKKLHIYNDHTFVAKHIPGGATCTVCSGRFSFSLGKQGYRCRDCKLICHKECHVRVTSFCVNTSVYDIELGTKKCEPGAIKTYDDSTYIISEDYNSTSSPNPTFTNNACVTKTKDTNNLKLNGTKPKKSRLSNSKLRLNIFRKTTKLGKISEENLLSTNEIVPLAESTLIESQ